MPTCASVMNLFAQERKGISVAGKKPNMRNMYRSEEKGTDVNLAAHLVNDAHLGRFEVAAVISNDSDLAGAISIVKSELGKVVGRFHPSSQKPKRPASTHGSFFREIKNGNLRRSLFPNTLTDGRGTFSKPVVW
jgi:hypothetical protein